MTTEIIPEVGASGLFKGSAPFDTLINAQTKYTCKGVRKLSEIIASGEVPFQKYYEPVGLLQTDYDADLAIDASIVVLTSGTGQWLYIPSTKLTAYPDPSGVTYKTLMLGVSLGAVADTVSLDALKTSISNLVTDMIGVNTVIKEIAISPPAIITHGEHTLIETARAARISITKSDHAKYLEATARADTLQTKLTALETWVKAHI